MTKRRPIRAPGMDLNAGDVSGDLGIEPGQKEQPVPVQPVGYPVKEDGVYARIQQKYLQLGSGRRVPGLIGRQSLGKSFEHRGPSYSWTSKNASHAQRHEEASSQTKRGSTLVSHSRADNGAIRGTLRPAAPGCTSRRAPVGPLSAGGVPSLPGMTPPALLFPFLAPFFPMSSVYYHLGVIVSSLPRRPSICGDITGSGCPAPSGGGSSESQRPSPTASPHMGRYQ